METLKQKVEQNHAPFLEQQTIPLERKDMRIVLGLVDDPDVLEFVETHPTEMASSDMNMAAISGYSPREAVVYKVLHRDEGEPERIIELIYLIKKGMDPGSLWITYVMAQDHQGKKLATASVGAVTEEIGKKYDLVANIDGVNEPSMRLAERLGYFSLNDMRNFTDYQADFTPFFRPRSSRIKKRSHF